MVVLLPLNEPSLLFCYSYCKQIHGDDSFKGSGTQEEQCSLGRDLDIDFISFKTSRRVCDDSGSVSIVTVTVKNWQQERTRKKRPSTETATNTGRRYGTVRSTNEAYMLVSTTAVLCCWFYFHLPFQWIIDREWNPTKNTVVKLNNLFTFTVRTLYNIEIEHLKKDRGKALLPRPTQQSRARDQTICDYTLSVSICSCSRFLKLHWQRRGGDGRVDVTSLQLQHLLLCFCVVNRVTTLPWLTVRSPSPCFFVRDSEASKYSVLCLP